MRAILFWFWLILIKMVAEPWLTFRVYTDNWTELMMGKHWEYKQTSKEYKLIDQQKLDEHKDERNVDNINTSKHKHKHNKQQKSNQKGKEKRVRHKSNIIKSSCWLLSFVVWFEMGSIVCSHHPLEVKIRSNEEHKQGGKPTASCSRAELQCACPQTTSLVTNY